MTKRQWETLKTKVGWWEAYRIYLSLPSWKKLRKQVLKRDKYQCQTCQNKEDFPLEIHHRRGHDNVPNCKVDELIALCKSCHEAITSNDRARRYEKFDDTPN